MVNCTAFNKLCDQIDINRVVSDLVDMIAIPSANPFQSDPRPQYREQEMAEYYADKMSELDLDVGMRDVVPGRPNVWGVLKGRGTGPSVMLSGHLDTVGIEGYEEGWRPRVDNNRGYGRGACDMKDALAGYLEVVRVIRAAGIELGGDLILTGIADEEDQMIGSKDLGQHGPWADYGIIGEPSDLSLCSAHKGQVGYMIRALGRAVHSSRPETGVNAIEGMMNVVEALGVYRESLLAGKSHELCGHARCCPSVIRGGTIVSTVPNLCEMEVDRRTLPGESREDVYGELKKVLDDVKAAHPEYQFDIAGPTIDVPPLDVPSESPVVQAVVESIHIVTGTTPSTQAFSGGTDAPNFGFPTLIYGAGSLEQAHSIDEYVEISDMKLATKVYLLSTLMLLANLGD